MDQNCVADVGTVKIKDLHSVFNLLKEVGNQLELVKKEWEQTKQGIAYSASPKMLGVGNVIVSKASLGRLKTQCEHANQFLPQMSNLSQDLSVKAHTLAQVQQDYQNVVEERDSLTAEVNHWKTKLNESVSQAQKDKQANLNLQMDLQELTTQLCDQCEFCSGAGSTLATVIWRLSRQEDAVVSIVTGPKLAELLTLVSSCIQSFLTAYKDDDQWPEQTVDEANFILALTGTFTNLAASAVGREHLSTKPEGLEVINTFLTFLAEAPSAQTARMKSLMLTGLYNLSINQKGVKYLCRQPQLIPKLTAILQSDVADHQSITLRLMMSLIAEEDGPSNVLLQLRESLPKRCVEHLATSSGDGELKHLALELLSDLRHAETEP